MVQNKIWLKIAVLVFLISIFLGIITFFFRQLPTYPLISDSLSKISDIGKQSKNADSFGRFLLIYGNNLSSMAIILFGGFIFGIFTFIGLFANGMILGFFAFFILFTPLPNLIKIILLAAIIPHGVIELSLLIIVSAWGFKLGFEHLLPKSKGRRLKVFIDNFKNSFWILLLLVYRFSHSRLNRSFRYEDSLIFAKINLWKNLRNQKQP